MVSVNKAAVHSRKDCEKAGKLPEDKKHCNLSDVITDQCELNMLQWPDLNVILIQMSWTLKMGGIASDYCESYLTSFFPF